MARPKKVNLPKGATAKEAVASTEDKEQKQEESQQAPIEEKPDPEPEQPSKEDGHTIGTATITNISTGKREVVKDDPRLVTIEVSYPKGYDQRKIMKEGVRKVSPESADIFVKKGIAKRV